MRWQLIKGSNPDPTSLEIVKMIGSFDSGSNKVDKGEVCTFLLMSICEYLDELDIDNSSKQNYLLLSEYIMGIRPIDTY